ncbi:Putative DDH domain, DHHA2 domain, DHHA2 domain superfamily, DHH phosphoesterase superfamily [Septoria linicola]|uniref:DDH domain, DHHA2 domain, DHHA2 domain superfamily, DHH phosphoesterase superfamily n=1 Tax=Septoria linicola TaxID=215465 RepID=A0A9Q9AZN1_9PEZI|nr:putative DDH domain, DHHA2 domain, DHHA2 domain superfamily, DHH phosphoesterase superfamily [Septoria linicola]USW58957.1 Putative DDH domain, DHHA2 domain, DHHA2 domain superfamily, DHH phosphoesterase superfamily [Septoria linicola]
MRYHGAIVTGMLASAACAAPSPDQAILKPSPVRPYNGIETGVGHFSEWSRATKKEFLIDWQAGKSDEWIFVQGNEGGDLDSMTAALTWAYHLEHSTQNTSKPIKAIALLQTPTDALDLRPENKLALDNSQMSTGHSDLLTIDELPGSPETLARQLKGIILVDHPVPLRKWNNAKLLSIFDHHVDSGAGPDAKPRIFEKVASCTTLVARQMLDELEALPEEYHMPHELLELILGAIAIDSKGLEQATEEDRKTAQRVLERSNWHKRDLDDKMQKLAEELKDAKKDLDDLTVRDLLRRDYKGDLVDTPSPRTPTVSLGFASIPFSLDEQIEKTEFGALFDWFAIEAAWTAQVGMDISVALNKYKVKDEHGKKQKIREIVLVVRSDVRIDEDQADDLFRTVSKAIEEEPTLKAKPWYRADELGQRQMVWTHEREDAGRKVIRPIIEKAVEAWD